jgi:hypothetical protein
LLDALVWRAAVPRSRCSPVWALADGLIDQHCLWPATRLRRSVALQAKIDVARHTLQRGPLVIFGAKFLGALLAGEIFALDYLHAD